MIVNGKKWACETCVKGHRASRCSHSDRPLVEIQKKGRPATQCKRCRELRIVRQLHVKCDCNNKTGRSPSLRTKKKTSDLKQSKKQSPETAKGQLRAIAPRPEVLSAEQCNDGTLLLQHDSASEQEQETQPVELVQQDQISSQQQSPPSPPSPCCSSTTPDLSKSVSSCCSTNTCSTVLTSGPPKPCCSSEKVNEHGERIRVVTCRCGDSCACVGCDAHPSRAMKGKKDPYTGFAEEFNARRRLSIAAICSPSDAPTPKLLTESEQPTAVLAEDGSVLCGCGCAQSFDSCSSCFRDLCQGYYTLSR